MCDPSDAYWQQRAVLQGESLLAHLQRRALHAEETLWALLSFAQLRGANGSHVKVEAGCWGPSMVHICVLPGGIP